MKVHSTNLAFHIWNELTFLWTELTILWNDLTIDWNDLTWNDLTMERDDRKSAGEGIIYLTERGGAGFAL